MSPRCAVSDQRVRPEEEERRGIEHNDCSKLFIADNCIWKDLHLYRIHLSSPCHHLSQTQIVPACHSLPPHGHRSPVRSFSETRILSRSPLWGSWVFPLLFLSSALVLIVSFSLCPLCCLFLCPCVVIRSDRRV
jgi:hypothetical protein